MIFNVMYSIIIAEITIEILYLFVNQLILFLRMTHQQRLIWKHCRRKGFEHTTSLIEVQILCTMYVLTFSILESLNFH